MRRVQNFMELANLIAYRGTGKDTLANALIQRNMVAVRQLGWKVFAPPFKNPLKFDIYPPVRVALADDLKEELCDEMNLSREFYYSGEMDKLKDRALDECPHFVQEALNKAGYPRLREAMIDMAKRRKSEFGVNYYVDLVRHKIEQANQDGQTVLLTDPRSVPDLRSGLTVRLFRGDVDIPPPTEMSERALDSYPADMVLCKSTADMVKLKMLQPQYETFVKRCHLADIVNYVST